MNNNYNSNRIKKVGKVTYKRRNPSNSTSNKRKLRHHPSLHNSRNIQSFHKVINKTISAFPAVTTTLTLIEHKITLVINNLSMIWLL